MKVIATADKNENIWKHQYTCTGKGWEQHGKHPCGALLEIEATDLFKRNHTDYSGCTDTYYGFECCECGCFTEINTKDIPNEVLHMAKKYKHSVS